MSDLNRAIEIAAMAHRGQKDKGGEPYILHPLRVMMAMDDDAERIVAVLHDVVEDCPDWSLDRLMNEGIDSGLVWSVGLLTRKHGESYEEFIVRCGTSERARKVKLADLRDNMNMNRLGRAPNDDDLRRMVRYQNAVAILDPSPPSQ